MDGFKRFNNRQSPPGPAPQPVNPQPAQPQLQSRPQLSRPDLPPVKIQRPGAKYVPPQARRPVQAVELPQIAQLPPVRKPSKKRLVMWWLLGILVAIIAAAAGSYGWYNWQLTPINPADKSVHKIEIKSGDTFLQTAAKLKDSGLIRSELGLDIYTRLTNTRGKLQSGTCSLHPSDSLPQIVDKLVAGCHDFISVMFFPGATLTDYSYKSNNQNVTAVLKRAGYSDEAIAAALAKKYIGTLFADKPADADLEGYVYGETYYVSTGASVEDVLQKSFDEMYSQIEKYDLMPGFKKQGLNLYQAITLASIIEREVRSPEDMQQVAQVFYKRLAIGMPLGADATSVYASKMLGIAPSISANSPYNTRLHPGLPPGPIASPGLDALKAVANPATGNYLFFVSGDDNKTYFASTQDEHEANVKKHCQKLCSEL